jgi:hypothetical protein
MLIVRTRSATGRQGGKRLINGASSDGNTSLIGWSHNNFQKEPISYGKPNRAMITMNLGK